MEIVRSKLQFWDNLIYEERIVREENGPLLFQTIMLGTLENDNVRPTISPICVNNKVLKFVEQAVEEKIAKEKRNGH